MFMYDFEMFISVEIHIVVLRVMTPCSLVGDRPVISLTWVTDILTVEAVQTSPVLRNFKVTQLQTCAILILNIIEGVIFFFEHPQNFVLR
jgi:hypothetical protein